MFEEEYVFACNEKTDINEHLTMLYSVAKGCEHITEMGVRSGMSTRAFLHADPKKLVCYDIYIDDTVNELFEKAKVNGKDFHYLLGDTTEIQIEQTDLLFIDTLHKYEQLKMELTLHADNVNKYIIFHDTETFGVHGQQPNVDFGYEGKGILFAIDEFLTQNKNWEIVYKTAKNNGLMIIERK